MRDRRRTVWLYLKVRLSLVRVMGKLEFRIVAFDTHSNRRASPISHLSLLFNNILSSFFYFLITNLAHHISLKKRCNVLSKHFNQYLILCGPTIFSIQFFHFITSCFNHQRTPVISFWRLRNFLFRLKFGNYYFCSSSSSVKCHQVALCYSVFVRLSLSNHWFPFVGLQTPLWTNAKYFSTFL